MEAGGGWGRAEAPPPSLPAGLRAPERLFRVCARGGRVRFGSPLPLIPGLAAPAFSAATPSLPSCRPFSSLLPSSFPSSPPPPPSPPPRTAGRGTSAGEQPGEEARPGLAAPARAPRPRGGGRRVGPRPRRARAPGLLPRASRSARGAFPEEAGPPAPPASGRPAAWTPGAPSPSTSYWGQKQVPRRLSSFLRARRDAEVIPGAEAEGPRFKSLRPGAPKSPQAGL